MHRSKRASMAAKHDTLRSRKSIRVGRWEMPKRSRSRGLVCGSTVVRNAAWRGGGAGTRRGRVDGRGWRCELHTGGSDTAPYAGQCMRQRARSTTTTPQSTLTAATFSRAACLRLQHLLAQRLPLGGQLLAGAGRGAAEAHKPDARRLAGGRLWQANQSKVMVGRLPRELLGVAD